ncbi:MAG: Beta-barrel assembly-enhancing protease [Phycisphaerae bacterium]|nr:Beta-barrel assembly-enhancing protease [Phycisphaerae bacterium]
MTAPPRAIIHAATACALLVCALGSTAGCNPAGSGSSSQPLNVLLISIDTTRADHLGCYGNRQVRTPAIDRLASEGVLFEQCISPAPLTLPSHATMLTGRLPFVHGARNNGQFRLHEENDTLAEAFKEAGYVTAAEVAAAVLDREYGVNQGFDSYTDVKAARGRARDRRHTEHLERSAQEVADSAIAWLDQHAGEKFFLFVHFFDPHQPYLAPERFATQYPDPYLAEIAYADEQVGRLIAALDRSAAAKRTLVILTSDHGEGRGQHKEATHGNFIYNSTQRVPLIMRAAGRIPAGRRVSSLVRLTDIAPTALAMAGLEPLESCQGANLLPVVGGGGGADATAATDLKLDAYAETLCPRYDFGYSHLRALWSDGFKYIHAPRPELYDLSTDPDEQLDLAAAQPQRVAGMAAKLKRLILDAPRGVAPEKAIMAATPESVRAMQHLGYVGGEAEATSEADLLDPIGPDPKDHAEDITRICHALAMRSMKNYPAAEQIFRELISRFPPDQKGFYRVHLGLAETLQELRKFDEAASHFEKALEARPDDAQALTGLGMCLMKLNRPAEAIERFDASIRATPGFARAYLQKAGALAAAGDLDQAAALLRRTLELDPEMVAAYVNLGTVYGMKGDATHAAEAFRKALAIEPENEGARRGLQKLGVGP